MKGQKLVSLVYDLIEDSTYFLHEAEKLDRPNVQQKERLIRASILAAWAGFEGWINKTASDFATSMKGLQDLERAFLIEKRVELKSGQFTISNSDKYESTENKMEFLIVTLAGKKLDKSDKYWVDFGRAKKVRDSIVHPKVDHRVTFTIDDARLTFGTLEYYRKLLSKRLYG